MQVPEKTTDFFPWLKKESEDFWQTVEITPGIYGYQIQKGTSWGAGLDNQQIKQFEQDLDLEFPSVYKEFLRNMNGTDPLSINVYGESGEPYAYAPAYYSYPRDIEIIKDSIKWVCDSFDIKISDIDGEKIPFIVPIMGHRFLVWDKTGKTCCVLSMYGDDVIPYASSLQNFLVDDIFDNHAQGENVDAVDVGFWLD